MKKLATVAALVLASAGTLLANGQAFFMGHLNATCRTSQSRGLG